MAGRPRAVSDDAVFDAVASVVTSAGPGGLTLSAVAERVGISAPALAQRFGSKRQLLVAFATRESGSVTDLFTTRRADYGDALSALVGILAGLPSGIRTRAALANNLALLQMDITDAELRKPAVAQSRQVRSNIARLLTEAFEAGQLCSAGSTTAIHTLAADLYAVYNGAMLTWAIDGKGKLVDWLATHLERALAPHRSPAAAPSAGRRPSKG